MSGDERRGGGLPMHVRVVDGKVNEALGWHEGLEKRACTVTEVMDGEVTLMVYRAAVAPYVILTVGRTIVQATPMYPMTIGTMLRFTAM